MRDQLVRHEKPPQKPTAPERALLVLSVLWIACIPTLFVFGNRSLEGIPVVTFDRVFYLVITALLVLCVLRRPKVVPTLNGVDRAMGVYLVVVVLSWLTTLAHKDPTTLKQDADFLLTSFFMPFTAYVIARYVAWTRRRILACLWVLVGGVGLYLAIVGIVQSTYDWQFLGLHVGKCLQCERARGPFSNSLVYGLTLSILLVLGLLLYLQSRTRMARVAAFVMATVILEAVVLSKGRAVWLGVPLAMLLVAWRYRRARWLAALVTVGLVGQVFISSVALPRRSSLDRGTISARLTEVESIYDRIAVYTTDVNMIRHKPLFGFGFGLLTFERNKADYTMSCCGVSTKWLADCHVPHNDVLNVLILMGVVGLVAYFVLLSATWRLLSANGPGSPVVNSLASELALVVQASFVVLATAALFHDVMYMSYVQILLFFLLGMVTDGRVLQPRPASLDRMPRS